MLLRPPPKVLSELDQLVPPEARCSEEDPDCGPEPLRRGEPVCFRPAAARERLPPGDEAPAPTFRCAHDGECRIAGCGNVCVGYPYSHIETNCIGYPWLDDRAWCGCVEGGCSFFRQ